jgi:hypothetical protein
MAPHYMLFRKPPRAATMVVDGFLWIEAEDFADYGDWRLDTQFGQQMGSAYLIAAGGGAADRRGRDRSAGSSRGTVSFVGASQELDPRARAGHVRGLGQPVHAFPVITADKLRLTVDATGGDKSARIFDIRAYDETQPRVFYDSR